MVADPGVRCEMGAVLRLPRCAILERRVSPHQKGRTLCFQRRAHVDLAHRRHRYPMSERELLSDWMRRFIVAASFLLIAATPGDVVRDLEDDGYYIEPGSSATEQVASDAVFEARADGGRLYLVVLADEPAGGAPTFSDSVLDRLGNGYVVTVAPETVGFAGDGSFWTTEEMDVAIDASLSASSDDQVIEIIVAELTDTAVPTPDDGEDAGTGSSGWIWMLLLGIGAAVVAVIWNSRSKKRAELETAELERVKAMAREKLAEIANDVIEMEDEVTLSDDSRVKDHYRKASATYTEALARVDESPGAQDMIEVIRELDMAIWELDAAEALLDGNPIPDQPKAPEPKPPQPPQPSPAGEEERPLDHSHGRRSQRQSSYAGDDLMTALWALLAMSGRSHGGWGGTPGGFGGPMGGGGSGRMRGGGTRGGGLGRIRGGGRRR